jgi:hypothetical protein
MNHHEESLLRSYAGGTVSWSDLRAQGFDDYAAVLGGLGELGLRPPVAPLDGPNAAARERGRDLVLKLLSERQGK